jgi:hypothetical protein
MGNVQMTVVWPSPTVRLPEFWSPSSLNVLKICPMRLAYSFDENFGRKFRKGNTYAAMGVASHKLSERAWKQHFKDIDDAKLETALADEWAVLVQKEHEKLSTAWSPAIVPIPRDWPYFALTQVRTVARVANEVRRRMVRGAGGSEGSVRVEQRITDEVNRIDGIPDRVVLTENGFYVLDLKTGHAVSVFSDSYRRQLLIYAHLVSLTTSKPLLGLGLVTAGGETIWGNATQQDMEQVLIEVQSDIAAFRKATLEGELIAIPSPQNCRFCPFKAVCPSYWKDASPDWSDYRGVHGRVVRVIDDRTFTVEQIYPNDLAGQLIGVSNSSHEVRESDIVSVTDGLLRGQSLRGSWYTRTVTLKEQR